MLIWRAGDKHALRLTASSAFLTPSQIEYFLSATAAVTDLTPLENGLRSSPLGPALAAVPQGTLFTTSGTVPVLVRGNRNLEPEGIRSFELGYKGRPLTPLFLTVDAFFSRRSNFVTSLLPATSLNPDYPMWTAPDEVPVDLRGVVEGGVRDALRGTIAQFGLTRLPDGQTAIVLSYGNAGLAEDYGVESGASLWLARWLRVDGSATWYRSDIKQQAAGDTLVPNTPELKGTVGVTYQGTNGLDLGLHLRSQQAFEWRSGLYRGEVPAYTTVDLNVAWQATPLLLVHGVAMNVFDDRHFEVYGGAVTGRRILGGITATF
jgi:outer membrane receptor protein involved in Fe transport